VDFPRSLGHAYLWSVATTHSVGGASSASALVVIRLGALRICRAGCACRPDPNRVDQDAGELAFPEPAVQAVCSLPRISVRSTLCARAILKWFVNSGHTGSPRKVGAGGALAAVLWGRETDECPTSLIPEPFPKLDEGHSLCSGFVGFEAPFTTGAAGPGTRALPGPGNPALSATGAGQGVSQTSVHQRARPHLTPAVTS
jgi:hypothetical protein